MIDDLMEMLAVVLLPFAFIAFQILLVMLVIIIIFVATWRAIQGEEN